MRVRIFRSVLLPAPLAPMIPTTSPCSISNETSLSAQNVSDVDFPVRLKRPTKRRGKLTRSSCSVLRPTNPFRWWAILKNLLRFATEMAMSDIFENYSGKLNDVCKVPFDAAEEKSAAEQCQRRHNNCKAKNR